MAELGKMEKPEAEGFKKARKLILVPLVYAAEGAPPEYAELCNKYWAAVRTSVESLEARLGPVGRIYHEAVHSAGPEGLAMVEKMSVKSHELAQQRCERGAAFEALEDEEALSVFLDWQRCLSIGFISNSVASRVSELYVDAMKRRFDLLSKRIGDSLAAGETGLLFVAEDNKLQFPADVEVFYVAPPALDEIQRWLRDRRAHREDKGQPPEGENK